MMAGYANRQVVARLTSAHVRGQLLVNGCLAWQSWDARPTAARIPLVPYLQAGDNEVVLLLRDAAPPPTGPRAGDEPELTAELGWAVVGAPLDEYLPWLSYTWTDEESALGPEPLTRVLAHRFRLEDAAAVVWREARPLDDAVDRLLLEALVTRVHGAVERRDTKELAKLLAVKHADLARGWRTPKEDVELEILGELGDLYAESDFRLEPLRVEQLVLEPRFAGKLVHVRAPDGGPPIRASGGGKVLAVPLGVSCLDKVWTIVR